MNKYLLGCAVWEFTLECNLNCSHCGSKAGKVRRNELTTLEAYGLCEDLAAVNCEMVSLMGGEPFIRKDWESVSWCIKDLGMDLSFVSNGILVPKYIQQLDRLEPKVVGISVDGLRETHDSIRSKGSYDSAIKAIDLLTEHSIQTTVITTVSKTNFNDIRKLQEIFIEKGVNWQIQVAEPFGNFNKDLAIDEEEFYALALFIVSENVKNQFKDMPVVGGHCFGYYSHLLPRSDRWQGCTAGNGSVGITSDGSIVGCLSIGNNQYFEGNVRERSFVDIWEDPNSFSYNRKFTVKDLGENCRGCYFGDRCKGGCNSMSVHFSGAFHNTPYCLRKIEEHLFEVKIPKKEQLFRKEEIIK